MNILNKIAIDKRLEVQERKEEMPVEDLQLLPLFRRTCFSLKQNLQNSKTGIIAEFKRRSPSLPEINLSAEVDKITADYEKAGACGISVLTDEKYFGGSLEDFSVARQTVKVPLLRKDFIIDPYQIYEAKAFGADVILLIAALLNPNEIREFSELAHKLGMEVLLEVHNEQELQQSLMPGIDLLGVNNRDLKTFELSLETSKKLSALIPEEYLKVSESGINKPESIKELQKFGFKGFLIGGNFMASSDPGASIAQFMSDLKKLEA